MNNVIQFPRHKETELINEENDQFVFDPNPELMEKLYGVFFPDNRYDFVLYMREFLSEEDYLEFLESIACFEMFNNAHEDIKVIVDHYYTLKI